MTAPALAYGFARRHGVVVLDLGPTAAIGLRAGADPAMLLEARRLLGRPIRVEALDGPAFDRKLSEIYAAEGLGSASDAHALELSGGLDHLVDEIPAAADLLDTEGDAPIIRLINGVIAEAVRRGVSDIHIEPFEAALIIRFRLDGVLSEALRTPARLAGPIVSRIKVMARLDIAERRVPQDGRISLSLGGKTLDVRISTLPSRGGERVVLRILDKDQASLSLDELGMTPDALTAFGGALREPNGIILVTGPTGSGKTTSLYAGLALLNDRTRNILTIEDPVEYAVEGVGQTQVNTKVGMTFAAGLRAILRQDPDVVMVGEIRDAETAQIAVQASLTGHLVLSTVHTNDAAGAVTRLRDMGVEPFLLASTIRVVVAQRLVRRLCPHCREEHRLSAGEGRALDIAGGNRVWRPRGCEACGQTGYVGRVGLYEVLRVTDKVRRLIGENGSEDEIAAAGFADSQTLKNAAKDAVLAGLTSIEEGVRVTRRSEADHGEL